MLLLSSLVLLLGTAAYGQDRPRVVQCPTSENSPCVCSSGIIDCSNRGLTRIPIFIPSPDQFYLLRLQGNSITQMGEGSFANLNVSEIYLGDNQIADIFPNSFHGLENSLEVLDLQNNNLIVLPAPLGDLNRLRYLNTKGNPIDGQGFTAAVLRNLGNSLKELYFGDHGTLVSWPSDLRHLPNLQVLDVIGERLPLVPGDAFHGFETTLRRLSISNTSLFSVPLDLSKLRNLIEFDFDFNPRVRDIGIPPAAFIGVLGSLRTLSLRGNSLTRLPDVLSLLHALRSVVLDYNHLQYITDDATQNVRSNISSVGLRNCGIERLPAALSTLTSLENIDVSQNNIATFERNDLKGLTNLRSLNMANNPLKYISTRGLDDLTGLQTLDFSNTNLSAFPMAINGLPNIVNLDLSVDRGIDCTCSLVWLNKFMQTHPSFRVQGQCETVRSSIQSYILSTLQNCPVF